MAVNRFAEYHLVTGREYMSGKCVCNIKGRKCEEIQKKLYALETITENQ